MVQVLALSFKLEIRLFCKSPYPLLSSRPFEFTPNLSGVIAKLSSAEQTGMTTLQRELVRFVMIVAGFAIAVAVLIVVLWAAWYEYQLFDFQRCSGNSILQASSFFPRYH